MELKDIVRAYYWIGQGDESAAKETTVLEHRIVGEVPPEIEPYNKLYPGHKKPTLDRDSHIILTQSHNDLIAVRCRYFVSDMIARQALYEHMLFLNRVELWRNQLTPLDFMGLVHNTEVKFPLQAREGYEKYVSTFDIEALQRSWPQSLKSMENKHKKVVAILATRIDSNLATRLYFERDKNTDVPQTALIRDILNTALRFSSRGLNIECEEDGENTREWSVNVSPLGPAQQNSQAMNINSQINFGVGKHAEVDFYRRLIEEIIADTQGTNTDVTAQNTITPTQKLQIAKAVICRDTTYLFDKYFDAQQKIVRLRRAIDAQEKEIAELKKAHA